MALDARWPPPPRRRALRKHRCALTASSPISVGSVWRTGRRGTRAPASTVTLLVVDDRASAVDLDPTAGAEQVLQLPSRALHAGFHARHGDAEPVGGLLVRLSVDIHAGERVAGVRGQLAEEWRQAVSEFAGRLVRLVG